MSRFKSLVAFAAAAAVAAPLLAACTGGVDATPVDVDTGPPPDASRVEKIHDESFSNGDGLYVIQIPGSRLGQPDDVTCVYVKDSMYKGGGGGLSCDWDGAPPVRVTAPAP